ncbi:MAG: glycerate dehydrogenase [Pyrinomonas sp.]|uniref:D-2-hydroxyacid dehydrogenase n=1 Tax=Pyrinomonas sp. TaxID=2080306 RepID=UPI0033264B38
MERVVFLDRGTIKVAIRAPRIPHEWIEYEATSPDQIVERLRGATVAITNKVPIREETLAAVSTLKLIVVAATGVDNVDLDACRRRGIWVCNARGYARRAVAEHALMLMLALRRKLLSYHEDVRHGRWSSGPHFCLLDHPIEDLHGATLGIIGYGAIGREVERLASAFGMRILRAERRGAAAVREGRTPFGEVLSASDILTLHVPLVEQTRALIGWAEIEAMPSHAILINCARGGVVDEAALAEALRAGRLAGAGIDVLSEEPPHPTHPLLAPDVPNLIVTPHNSWASRGAMRELAEQIVGNIESFARGEQRNRIV